MEILYIIKPPPLIIFILAHSDQRAMDFNFFFTLSHTFQLQYSNYMYLLVFPLTLKNLQLVKREQILLLFSKMNKWFCGSGKKWGAWRKVEWTQANRRLNAEYICQD